MNDTRSFHVNNGSAKKWMFMNLQKKKPFLTKLFNRLFKIQNALTTRRTNSLLNGCMDWSRIQERRVIGEPMYKNYRPQRARVRPSHDIKLTKMYKNLWEHLIFHSNWIRRPAMSHDTRNSISSCRQRVGQNVNFRESSKEEARPKSKKLRERSRWWWWTSFGTQKWLAPKSTLYVHRWKLFNP